MENDFGSNFFCRGPSYGCRGKVVLAFEDNGSSKIGVRFDKSIPDGNDLGGLCEEDHGFFCSGDFLISYVLTLLHYYMLLLYSSCCILVLIIDFYYAASHLLHLDVSGGDDIDKLAISELLEVILALY